MQTVSSLEELEEIIQTSPAVLVYFSSQACGVCNVLKPKIEKSVSEELPLFRIVEIFSTTQVEINQHYKIFSAPTILVFYDRNEFYRENGNLSVLGFIDKIKRNYDILFS